MASADASRDHGVLFARAYLDSKLEKLKEDQQTYLVETLKEWFEKTDSSSLKALVTSFVGPVLDVLGHIRSELEENSLTLYGERSRQKAVSLCYVVGLHESLDQTSKGRNYAVSLIIALRKIGLKWGILTNGLLWRVYCVKEKSPFETYFQVDLGEALRTRDSKETFLLAEFFSATAFVPSETGRCRLDDNRHESDEETREIEKHLESKIEGILGKICMGFIESEGKKSYTEDEKRAVFSNSIYLLYRILFALYAEARGLLPLQNEEYYAKSIQKLVNIAKENHAKGIKDVNSKEMWNSLCELFDWINRGNHALQIPPYNGGLFDDDEKPYLANHVINDAYLSEALFSLGFREESGNVARIDYNDLSVRPLGSLYEGILGYQLFIAPERMVRRKEKNVCKFIPGTLAGKITRTDTVIEKGDIYFSQSGEERKLTGSYYTPEFVVQYIVENSLRQRLADISKELRVLLNAHLEAHMTAIDDTERRRVEKYIDAELLSFIENKVLSVRVLDPAMGSGHFLVNAAHFLSNFIVESLYSTEWQNDSVETSPLSWRRRVVEKCIFGVDLNDLATELAKLSLWLITTDNKKPLTFLDHHLRTGNSLIGVKLDDLGILSDEGKAIDEGKFQTTLYYPIFRKEFVPRVLKLVNEMNFSTEEIEDVEIKKRKFVEWEKLKKNLQVVANTWLSTFFGHQIKEESYQLLLRNAVELKEVTADSKVEEIAETKKNHFFHWWLEFPEVFLSSSENNGGCGFDVVIGNPPYVRQEELREIKPYLEANYETYQGTADLFVYFFEKEIGILKEDGYFGMVVSNKWLRAGYGENLRKFLTGFWIEEFIDFGDLRVFADATIYPCIIMMRKIKKPNPQIRICKMETLGFDSLSEYVRNNSFLIDQSEISENGWNIQRREANELLKKLRTSGLPLEEYVGAKICYGIKTGLNEAFIIDEKKREELICDDPRNEELIKSFLTGAECKRYVLKSKKNFIILTKIGVEVQKYSAVYKHLCNFKEALEKRCDKGNYWYELRACSYYDLFSGPKIVWGNLAMRSSFSLDEKNGFHVGAPACILPTDSKYVLGILNSKLMSYFLRSICAERQGNFIEHQPVCVAQVPIRKPTETQEIEITKQVEKMLQLNEKLLNFGAEPMDERAGIEDEIKKTDSEIDELVYGIYGITENERRIIENSLQ